MTSISGAGAASWRHGFVAFTATIALLAAPLILSREAGAEQAGPLRLAENNAPAAASSETKPTGSMHRHHRRTMHRESVEDRIANLHTELKITAAEEGNWNVVAQTMRDNAAAMKKMVDDARAGASEMRTALDDLQTYQHFAQAHADGLRKLLDAFTVLYRSMPPDQQKIADSVFGKYEHRGRPRRGMH